MSKHATAKGRIQIAACLSVSSSTHHFLLDLETPQRTKRRHKLTGMVGLRIHFWLFSDKENVTVQSIEMRGVSICLRCAALHREAGPGQKPPTTS